MYTFTKQIIKITYFVRRKCVLCRFCKIYKQTVIQKTAQRRKFNCTLLKRTLFSEKCEFTQMCVNNNNNNSKY